MLFTARCLSPVKKAAKLEEKNNEGSKQKYGFTVNPCRACISVNEMNIQLNPLCNVRQKIKKDSKYLGSNCFLFLFF